MRLKNKNTGETVEFRYLQSDYIAPLVLTTYENDKPEMYKYNSLAELNEEWEDYEEPKEWYWFIEDNGIIQRSCHYEDLHPTLDKSRKEIGNYFDTKEEAEKAVEKLKAWKRLKDKGISFENKVIGRKWYLEPKAEPQQRTFDEANEVYKDITLIFGGEE